MGTESETFDAIAAGARHRPGRVEKLAYRAPGTMSVAAQPGPDGGGASYGEGGGRRAAGQVVDAANDSASIIAGLEERLRLAESGAAAELERLRRESREQVEQNRQRAERQAKAALDGGAEQVRAALESFHRERDDYFGRVEREVVDLALAIAAQILHREALLDPMLLAGAVRVALGQLGETTGVRLRCPIDQVERWREMLRGLPNPKLAPEVEADAALAPGDCVLEARVGAVNLGVRAQLEEVGRGFFDLLERKSGPPLKILGSVS